MTDSNEDNLKKLVYKEIQFCEQKNKELIVDKKDEEIPIFVRYLSCYSD